MSYLDFPLEKILSVSLEEYVATQKGKNLEYYELKGVDIELNCLGSKLKEAFALRVPHDAEVVVGYTASVSVSLRPSPRVASGKAYLRIANGTALIPKKGK